MLFVSGLLLLAYRLVCGDFTDRGSRRGAQARRPPPAAAAGAGLGCFFFFFSEFFLK